MKKIMKLGTVPALLTLAGVVENVTTAHADVTPKPEGT